MDDWDREVAEEYVEDLLRRINKKGESPEQARDYFLTRKRAPKEYVEAAVEEIRRLQKKNSSPDEVVRNPATAEDWYLGFTDDEGSWSRYCATLTKAERQRMIPTLDTESRWIVAQLANPRRPGARRKGLVLGSVQSGKTANYMAVIAKAVDAGYRFVIVLAGMHNSLRSQTQRRLEEDLVGDDWVRLTNEHEDFGGAADSTGIISNVPRTLAVVKKNADRLDNLCAWLDSIPLEVRERTPVLIIDDESDQATPNTKEDKDEVSGINRLLRRMWSLTRRGTYLAYSATPFANLLMDPDNPDDLFPSDFIATIPVGEGYMGPAQVFGTGTGDGAVGSRKDLGEDMVRAIPPEDVDAVLPPSGAEARNEFIPPVPESLKQAIDWFVVASAIRRARGQDAHSSMLVHTTHYAQPHLNMRPELERYVREELQAAYSDRDLDRFKAAWEREARRVRSEDVVPVTWNQASKHIGRVLDELRVKVDNSLSEDRLDYQKRDAAGRIIPQTVIAIGGGTLSRGLTLEGLVVSYFTRTSNSYDTLLQMGRWFGYRPGYNDLPRIWVSQGLDDDYAFLSLVEEELRDEIEAFKGSAATPAEIGVRIRCHPGRLQVTANNKMYHAQEVQGGFAGQLKQTTLMDGSDISVTERSITAVEKLVHGHAIEHLGSGTRNEHRWLWRGVRSADVQTFIDDFPLCFDADELFKKAQWKDWIDQVAQDAEWSVAVVGVGHPSRDSDGQPVPRMRIAGLDVNPVSRAPLGGGRSTASRINFKTVVSPNDRVIDIDPGFGGTTAQGRRLRYDRARGKGLILLYPISRYSDPRLTDDAGAGRRMALADLGVNHELLGMGIVFPDYEIGIGSDKFISVRANWEIEESPDEAIPDIEGNSRVTLERPL